MFLNIIKVNNRLLSGVLMKTTKIKHILFMLMFSVYSVACGWINGTTIDGKWVEGQIHLPYNLSPNHLQDSLNSTPRDRLHYFEKNFSSTERDDNVTKAVFSMLDGNYTEAIKQFLKEESREPERYEIAANLGTAYELSGDNVNALKWIQEGINRNPDSHFGTEWLHVKILEAKLELSIDPSFMKNNHVIDISHSGYNVTEALLYQLRERMLFVKPKDSIVADLLYSYALSNANDGGFLEYSMEALELSEKYGYLNPQELLDKKEEFQDIIDHVALMKNLKIVLYVALFFLLLFIAYKKKWFFLTRKAQQEHIEKSNHSEKTENVKNNRTEVDYQRPVVDNVIYFIMIFSLLFFLISIFVQITIKSYDILEENSGLVFTISAILTGVLEFIYLWKFDKFLNQDDVKIKEIRYGLVLTALGILIAILVPLYVQFFDYLMLNTGIFVFLTGTLIILGFFLVNSGLKAKRRATRMTKE